MLDIAEDFGTDYDGKSMADLNAERSELISRTTPTVPLVIREKYKRAMTGNSMRAAIDIKCAECSGFEDIIPRVRWCRSLSCPIWHMRPYQKKRK